MNLSRALALAVATDELTRKFQIDGARVAKGMRLLGTGKVQYREGLGWLCYSEHDSGTVYAVDPLNGLCTCPDSTNRDVLCKHFAAVWLEQRVRRIIEDAKVFLQRRLAAA